MGNLKTNLSVIIITRQARFTDLVWGGERLKERIRGVARM